MTDRLSITAPRSLPEVRLGLRAPQGPTFHELLETCRRNRWMLGSWIIFWLLLTLLALYAIYPAYRAQAEVVLDTRLQRPSNFPSVMSGPLTLVDPAPIIRSEVQTLQSTALADQVIGILGLDRSPEFKTLGLRAWIEHEIVAIAPHVLPAAASAWLTGNLHQASDPMRDRTELVDSYLHRLSIFNDGRSFSMGIAFWASDPYLAAEIANAHARQYVSQQRALKHQADSQAAQWLGRQVTRLQADLETKEQAMQELRERSGLIDAGAYTVLSQQVAQASQEALVAQADLMLKQAKVASAQRALAAGAEVQSDVLNSKLIQALRQQEAQVTRDFAASQSRYESGSPVLDRFRAIIADSRQQIRQEAGRIIAGMQNDAEIADGRLRSADAALSALQTRLVAQDSANTRLREMERDVAEERNVYREVLSRQQQIEAAAGDEIADARIVAPALVPKYPFYPNKKIIVPLSLAVSCISEIGITLIRSRLRRGVRSASDLGSSADTSHSQRNSSG